MKPFNYHAPASLDEAAALLAEPERQVRPMAGGTDLIVQLRAGRFDLDAVVDVKGIAEMNELSWDPAKGLTIGAAVPCCRIYEDRQIQEQYPAICDSASMIGSVAVQGRATIGGNVCNAAPSGDSLPTLLVLDAQCRVFGSRGERMVPIDRFFTGPGTTVLAPDELLVAILVPPPVLHSGARYLRFIPRNEMDIAVVGAGASIVLDSDGSTISAAKIALGAVAPTPILVPEAGDALIGKAPSEEAFSQAAVIARETARPIADMRGGIEYRRHLVGVLVHRALQGACDRAKNRNQK